MLRKREDSDVYEIDRELTWKWAVERNAELQEELLKLKGKHRRLEKQFKKLQVEHSRVLFDMDAVIDHEVDVKHKKAMEENRKLKELIASVIKMAYEKNDYDAMTYLIDESERLGFIYVSKSWK